MTKKEINEAIAELCGWKRIEKTHDPESLWPDEICITTAKDGFMTAPKPVKVTPRYGSTSYTTSALPPDYYSDLNAMHEAEKVLGNRWPEYDRHLTNICARECEASHFCSWHATAEQRAKTFLQVFNKWKE